MSDIRNLIQANPSLSDAEIAALHNASPNRYAKTERTARQLGEQFGTAIGDAVITALVKLAETSPYIALMLKAIEAREPIDLGNQTTRGVLSSSDLDDQIKAGLLSLATDTHGGAVTAEQVADVRAREARITVADEWAARADTWMRAAHTAHIEQGVALPEVR